MTIAEICEKAEINLDEVIKSATDYYNAKIHRPQYKDYLKEENQYAREILLDDCLQETLLSKLSLKGKLSLAFGKEG